MAALDASSHIIHAVTTSRKNVVVVAATGKNMPSFVHKILLVPSYIFHSDTLYDAD